MRDVLWPRAASLLMAILSLGTGCPVSDTPPDSLRRGDMSVSGDQGPAKDLTSGDMNRPPGSLGTPCTADTDCKIGSAPSCWKQQILDQPGNLPTPGGYCTTTCNADSDCGGQGICTTVAGQLKYCLASCSNSTTCRHPDYACWSLGKNNNGYCWPSTRLTCNPTTGTGQCDTVTPAKACIRQTFEDQGECFTECLIGPGNCQVGKTHCVYINATQDTSGVSTRDKYKGPACFPLYADAKQENAACQYYDECMDGLQCNLSSGGDGKCHVLCIVGLVAACASPLICKDVFGAGSRGAGLCLPN